MKNILCKNCGHKNILPNVIKTRIKNLEKIISIYSSYNDQIEFNESDIKKLEKLESI